MPHHSDRMLLSLLSVIHSDPYAPSTTGSVRDLRTPHPVLNTNPLSPVPTDSHSRDRDPHTFPYSKDWDPYTFVSDLRRLPFRGLSERPPYSPSRSESIPVGVGANCEWTRCGSPGHRLQVTRRGLESGVHGRTRSGTTDVSSL